MKNPKHTLKHKITIIIVENETLSKNILLLIYFVNAIFGSTSTSATSQEKG
jgi:hypothetical protein